MGEDGARSEITSQRDHRRQVRNSRLYDWTQVQREERRFRSSMLEEAKNLRRGIMSGLIMDQYVKFVIIFIHFSSLEFLLSIIEVREGDGDLTRPKN